MGCPACHRLAMTISTATEGGPTSLFSVWIWCSLRSALTRMTLKGALPVQESSRTFPFQSKWRTTHTGGKPVESKTFQCQHWCQGGEYALWSPGGYRDRLQRPWLAKVPIETCSCHEDL